MLKREFAEVSDIMISTHLLLLRSPDDRWLSIMAMTHYGIMRENCGAYSISLHSINLKLV